MNSSGESSDKIFGNGFTYSRRAETRYVINVLPYRVRQV